MATKNCSRYKKGLCKQINPQPLSSFHKDSDNKKDGLHSQCKSCNKEWRIANKSVMRKHNLFNSHGISIEQYNEFLIKQNHKCKICEIDELNAGKLGLVVDHDHETGFIRGLLCCACNRGIGFLRDNAEICFKARNLFKQ